MTEDTPEIGLAELAVMAICCLGMVALIIGVIALIVRAARRSNQPAVASAAPPPGVASPPVTLHLSVLALSFDAFFRAQVEEALRAPMTSADVLGQRVELVQRVVQALSGLEPQWRDFGYGEKDLAQLADTRTSFLAAVDDFRARAAGPGDGGPLTVLTLIVATRTVLSGVTALEDRAQVRALLDNRAHIDRSNLLGAEVVWSPVDGGLSEVAVRARFPEMAALHAAP